MRILDRYLIKHFLIPLVYCTISLIFLVLIADVFDNLDDFIRRQISLRVALRYYLNLIPFVYVQIIQWASFLSVLYLLVNMNFHNELTAMKVCGLEISTIIRPLVFSGCAIGIVTFLIHDRVVPSTYKIAKRIQEERIDKKREKNERGIFRNITYYGSGDRLYYAKVLSIPKKSMKDFIVLWLDKNKQTRKKIIARNAVWNGEFWKLKHVNEFELSLRSGLTDEPAFFETKIYPEITETPEEFQLSTAETSFVPYRELKAYLIQLKENGLKPYTETVDLYQRLSFPWNSLVVMFLAFPFLAKSATRKQIAFNVLLCLVAVFSFHISTAFLTALGKSGKIFPWLSAWLSSFLFGAGALYFLAEADR